MLLANGCKASRLTSLPPRSLRAHCAQNLLKICVVRNAHARLRSTPHVTAHHPPSMGGKRCAHARPMAPPKPRTARVECRHRLFALAAAGAYAEPIDPHSAAALDDALPDQDGVMPELIDAVGVVEAFTIASA